MADAIVAVVISDAKDALGVASLCRELGFVVDCRDVEACVSDRFSDPALCLLVRAGGSDSRSSFMDVCAELRAAHQDLPIVIFTGVYEPAVQVQWFEHGADDVIQWPCDRALVSARLGVWTRRLNPALGRSHAAALVCRDLVVDIVSRSAQRAGSPLKLTVKEFDLLVYLLRHQGAVQERLAILHAVWGDTWVGDDNLLDVYIRYLRKKIERPDLEPLIHTIRGVGFMLR